MKHLALTVNGTPMQAPTEIPKGGTNMLNKVLSVGLTLVLVFAVLFALLTVIQGGIQWTMSGGDKTKVEQARMRIVFGILGLLLIIGSFFIINFVYGLFGLSPL